MSSESQTAVTDPEPAAKTSRVAALRKYLREAHGLKGKAQVVRILLAGRAGRRAEPGTPVAVPMKGLDGEPIHLRPGSTDLSNAVAYLSAGLHRPPPGAPPMKRIVELGTNIGAGLTALALENPDAQLAGVEPDPQNLKVARLNTKLFGNRVEIVEGAIWDRDEDLVVNERAGAHGLVVQAASESDSPSTARLRGITIDQLLASTFPDEEIDYMHVTIEGSERKVFAAGGEWPERVKSLRVELHPYFGYYADECIEQLERLGYKAHVAPHPPDKWVMATRD